MATYPLQVEINEAQILKLQTLFLTAQKEIEKTLLTATDFGIANKKVILAQIETILEKLAAETYPFIETNLTDYYATGAIQLNTQLINIKAIAPGDVITTFSQINLDAITALVDDTALLFGESITGVMRSAETLLNKTVRDLLTQKIAEGIITGEALRDVRLTLKGVLQEQGIYALKDKAGRSWTLDRYSEMLFRTKAVEARNRGLINRMVEYGFDLVQVSSHPGSCPACDEWQGKVLSARGETKGYPTVADAEAGGLFHPNCKHAVNAIIPSLARKTGAYDL